MKIATKLRKRNRLLVSFRDRLHVSQIEAARLCGVPNNSWNTLELMREYYICPSHVEQIADYIGVHPASLVPSVASRWPIVFSDTDVSNVLDKDRCEMDRAFLEEQVDRVLRTLTYREREILKLRYGIGDGYTYTLDEVGKIFKINRERVRQVEAKAILKLQHPVRARKLEGFL